MESDFQGRVTCPYGQPDADGEPACWVPDEAGNATSERSYCSSNEQRPLRLDECDSRLGNCNER